MTEKTVRYHIDAAFTDARNVAYKLFKAERSAQLRGEFRKTRDGRGYDAASLEVGRLDVLLQLCPDLSGSFNLGKLREDAREDALAEWREEVFRDFLPPVDAEAA